MSDFPKHEDEASTENRISARIINQISPNRYKLTDYFEEKGISKNLKFIRIPPRFITNTQEKISRHRLSQSFGGFEILHPQSLPFDWQIRYF